MPVEKTVPVKRGPGRPKKEHVPVDGDSFSLVKEGEFPVLRIHRAGRVEAQFVLGREAALQLYRLAGQAAA